MYIVAIAWIYVVIMMSITEESVVAGAMTLVLYGILPLTIVLYIMGTSQRKRRRAALAAAAIQATGSETSVAVDTMNRSELPDSPDAEMANSGMNKRDGTGNGANQDHAKDPIVTSNELAKPAIYLHGALSTAPVNTSPD